MQNEIMLVLSVIVIYATVLCLYKILGKTGLYLWAGIATITANIEVLIIVNAFGMEQTLGNILFGSTFLVTDILSEKYNKESANTAVKVSILTNIIFIIISQSWFLYMPNESDWATPAIREVFSNTPRFMIVGIGVYAISQAFDVWFYHAIWEKTTAKLGDSKKGLWIRNNVSTLISQLINTILFTFGAFIGVYDMPTLLSILVASYIIFIFTSLIDTPAVYIARNINPKIDG